MAGDTAREANSEEVKGLRSEAAQLKEALAETVLDHDSFKISPDEISEAGTGQVFRGGRGDDIICAAGGNDTLHGGWGCDDLQGEADDDTLLGGHCADSHLGGSGTDDCKGGWGDDSLD